MKEFDNVNDLIEAVNAGVREVKLSFPDHVKNDPDKNLAEVNSLADFIETNPPLKTLDISDNNICSIGTHEIADAMRENTTLEKLYTRNNNLDSGVDSIAHALHSNKHLKILDISDNDIDTEGFQRLSKALKNNTSLKSLNISNTTMNDEDDKDTLSIFGALLENSSLEHLNVSSNYIGDNAALFMISMLQQNQSIQSINISDNEINSELEQKITTIVGLNPIGNARKHGNIAGIFESAELAGSQKDVASLVAFYIDKTDTPNTNLVCKNAYNKGHEYIIEPGRFIKSEIIRREILKTQTPKSLTI